MAETYFFVKQKSVRAFRVWLFFSVCISSTRKRNSHSTINWSSENAPSQKTPHLHTRQQAQALQRFMFTVGLGTESLLNLFLSIYYLHKYFSIIVYYYIGLFFILLLVYLITMEVLDSGRCVLNRIIIYIQFCCCSFESYQSTCQPGTRTRVRLAQQQINTYMIR